MNNRNMDRIIIALAIGISSAALIWLGLGMIPWSYSDSLRLENWKDLKSGAEATIGSAKSVVDDANSVVSKFQELLDSFNKFIASASAVLVSLSAYLVIRRNNKEPAAPNAEPVRIEPRGAAPDAGKSNADVPTAEQLRKWQDAYWKLKANAEREANRAKELEAYAQAVRARSSKYALTRAAFLVTIGISLLHFATGFIQIGLRYYLGSRDLPLIVNYAQTILLCLLTPIVIVAIYRGYLRHSENPRTTGAAFWIGWFGAVMSGAIYFLCTSPEGFVAALNTGVIPMAGIAVPWVLFIFVQRLVVLPVIAFGTCVAAHAFVPAPIRARL